MRRKDKSGWAVLVVKGWVLDIGGGCAEEVRLWMVMQLKEDLAI